VLCPTRRRGARCTELHEQLVEALTRTRYVAVINSMDASNRAADPVRPDTFDDPGEPGIRNSTRLPVEGEFEG
jgi:hypothetical protein